MGCGGSKARRDALSRKLAVPTPTSLGELGFEHQVAMEKQFRRKQLEELDPQLLALMALGRAASSRNVAPRVSMAESWLKAGSDNDDALQAITIPKIQRCASRPATGSARVSLRLTTSADESGGIHVFAMLLTSANGCAPGTRGALLASLSMVRPKAVLRPLSGAVSGKVQRRVSAPPSRVATVEALLRSLPMHRRSSRGSALTRRPSSQSVASAAETADSDNMAEDADAAVEAYEVDESAAIGAGDRPRSRSSSRSSSRPSSRRLPPSARESAAFEQLQISSRLATSSRPLAPAQTSDAPAGQIGASTCAPPYATLMSLGPRSRRSSARTRDSARRSSIDSEASSVDLDGRTSRGSRTPVEMSSSAPNEVAVRSAENSTAQGGVRANGTALSLAHTSSRSSTLQEGRRRRSLLVHFGLVSSQL